MITNIVIHILDIIALLFLLGLSHGFKMKDTNRKRAFSYGIVLTVLVIISETGTIIASQGGHGLRVLNIICNVMGFSITPIIPLVLIAIFDIKILQLNRLVLIPTIVNIIVTVLSPWFGLIFYIDSNNNYERGSVFVIFMAAYIINILLFAVTTWYVGQKYLYPIKWKIIILSVFVLAGTSIQPLFTSIYLSWHCVAFTLFLLYVILVEFEGSFDTVTKLYNRSAFEKVAKQMKNKQKFALVILDINDFKEINDNYGHKYGDVVLQEVAAIIKKAFANNCTCYRIGGDEFCVIRRDANRTKLEKQIKYMINELIKTRESDSCLPMVAHGYSIYSGDETLDIKKIFNEADKQMYYHKRTRNAGH